MVLNGVDRGSKRSSFWQFARREPHGAIAVDKRERHRWEGHKLESGSVEEIKRIPPHLQNPWLKRIGYFKKEQN